jgi:hypothetical protein
LFIWSWSNGEKEVLCQCFGYDPCLLHHVVHFPCRHDFQLDGFYPCFEMSCFDGPHFSYCGTFLVSLPCVVGFLMLRGFSRANFSISYSSLICFISMSPPPPSELWKLHRILGHMSFDLLCRLSGLVSHPVLRPKPDDHRMYAQDQVVIHTARI